VPQLSKGGERKMDDELRIQAMDDPEFLAERSRVRETIEALQERYDMLNSEFDRRAAAKWAAGSGVA
jgi:hypothetical protein